MTDPARTRTRSRPSAQNQLAVSKADVVIENGGGYDDFMRHDAAAARTTTSAAVLNVVDLSG